MVWRVLSSVLCFGAAACSSGQAPPAETPASEPAPLQLETNQHPLYRALSKLPRAGSPLKALPKPVLQKLNERVDGLQPQAKAALLDPNSPLAVTRPLLHLAAGGQALTAYHALYSSPAGSGELLEQRLPDGEIRDLPEIANRVAELAASHVLRERAVDFAPGQSRDVLELEHVAGAAQAVGRHDIELLALEELAAKQPDPEYDLRLARLHAERLEPEAAGSLLQRAEQAPGFERVQAKVAAARQLAAQASGSRAVLERARARLTLGHAEKARDLLKGHPKQLGRHLGHTTAYIRALAGASACPDIKPKLSNVYLCAEGWRRLREQFDLERLRQAWKSGAGRDAQAVEEYLGIMWVVPMTYGIVEVGKKKSPQEFFAALEGLQKDSREATRVAPRFSGVAALAGAVRVALKAARETPPGQRPSIDAEQRAKLLEQVEQLQHKLGKDFWAQAAILGSLAVVTPEQDVGPQLKALHADVAPELLPTQGALALWHILADGDLKAFEQSKQLLTRIVQGEVGSSLERSKWLLLWAEAEAHLKPGERSYATVVQMAERLLTPEVPLNFRLRARLDLAGIRARQGDLAGAIEVLEPLVSSTARGAVSSRLEQELLVAATGYLLVLRALSTSGEEMQEYADKLQALLVDVTEKSAAPPTLRLWLALWRGELEYLLRKSKCAGNAYCERRAERARGMAPEQMAQAVGARTAQLLSRGVLTVGGVEIKFSYQADGGLRPKLSIDSRFLLAHSPPLDTNISQTQNSPGPKQRSNQ